MTAAAPTQPLRWVISPEPAPEQVTQLAQLLNLPQTLAALLIQRGFGEPDRAREFLRPSLAALADPLTLAGMGEAVTAIVTTVRAGGTILVHGDYDVDGQCASALLTRALRLANATVIPFVPHRLRDGYDFGPAGLSAAVDSKASLIITVDCGITAVETVQAARATGIDVIVTDHHLPGTIVPPANAIVNPQRPDDTSSLKMLCGTGVAFKLVQALVPALGLPVHLPLHLLDLVALATVADLVPLVGENRILVKHGLKLMQTTRWPGLASLIRMTGRAEREIKASHLGFMLGPRLNAAGRVGDAADGLRLLLTDDPAEADRLAGKLEVLNTERQALDQQILEEVLKQVEVSDLENTAGFVIAGDGWHPGVVGIVASRVVERYGRPTFIVAFDGDVGKGSGRSISRFDLHEALVGCGNFLDRFGGHHMAAGLTIHRPQLTAFREHFAALAREQLDPGDLGPEQRVDLEVTLEQLTTDLEKLCRYLEPCGMGNPGPVFGVRGVRFSSRKRVGNGHLKGVMARDASTIAAIGFDWADRVPWLCDDPVDVAFRLECNEWQGRERLQARVVGISPVVSG
ncbi:MAG: single-stranded-DNA-specific exonuclease RecJ [Gemmatimonadota bacterium]